MNCRETGYGFILEYKKVFSKPKVFELQIESNCTFYKEFYGTRMV